jgi:adenine-specific DNA-methyltransferase
MAKKNNVRTKVESIRHKDKRSNIPTEELRDFVVDQELAPNTMLYPRDQSLDPQLVWKGKDAQDREDLAVPMVPIYIQEKIHPQAIIDALPRTEQPGDDQSNLFADFNGGPADFAQKIDFYHHEQNWSNRLILGDSLLVMTSLAEKEGLKGKVQTIYLDPPYGIKFGSNWQVSTRASRVDDGKAKDVTRQPEQVKAFRDTWQLGIHSYLAYLRDRLVVAHELLTETGSIFVQISDTNLHLVRNLLDETFGSENFIGHIVFQKKGSQSGDFVPPINEYLVWYGKSKAQTKFRPLYRPRDLQGVGGAGFDQVELADGRIRDLTEEELEDASALPAGARVFRSNPLFSQKPGPNEPVILDGKPYPSGGNSWKVSPSVIPLLHAIGRTVITDKRVNFKRYADDFSQVLYSNLWTRLGGASNKVYVVQTNVEVVKRCLIMTTDPGDLVLDPTCGSGTTAYVAEQWGRRWITCDTSRVALALARTRLMAAKYPYYVLADSPEGIKKETELTGKIPPEHKTEDDIRKGFVYERVPHVTLKSIANNPDINEGMTREQIDAVIARNAETEMLYDKPYEDNKRVRVCGPFSVESLSPHRVLSTADENQSGTWSEQDARKQQDFAAMILDNLKKAGVQNTRKSERLTFDRLDPYAGVWLNAAGEYTDAGGKTRRVAITIGPEHGTVGPQQVKEAAKEAVQGLGFDMLIVCGFAFDPHVAEEVKRYGKLIVLPTKMNPDLAMGDELLKKTGAGNLFMVFGEPDVEIKKQKNGQFVAEIKGVDVYDPTTGQIRSASTDDIACWFIDTDYNSESFFVRHAYFTGAEEPYDKLKRALRAEIDEAAWSALYSTISRPFGKPKSGKIAIKVINHYGDEVLKVFEA